MLALLVSSCVSWATCLTPQSLVLPICKNGYNICPGGFLIRWTLSVRWTHARKGQHRGSERICFLPPLFPWSSSHSTALGKMNGPIESFIFFLFLPLPSSVHFQIVHSEEKTGPGFCLERSIYTYLDIKIKLHWLKKKQQQLWNQFYKPPELIFF